jgi:uncharacterized protein YukE
MNLEKQANQDFKPSVVGLTQAFENLGKANLTLTGYQELVGKLFATQAKVLAEASGEAKKMEEAITGTNIAEEQAKTNTDNLDGSLKALSSAWEGLNLHINDSNGFLRDCVDWLKDVVRWADQAFTSAGRAAKLLQQIRGGEGQNHSDQVQTRLDALRNASPEERDAINRRNAEYFTSMETQAWKMAQKTKAELDNTWIGRSVKRYRLQQQYEKYVNSANAYRALGQEYAASANAIMNPVADAPVPVVEPTVPKSSGGKTGKKVVDEVKKEIEDALVDSSGNAIVSDGAVESISMTFLEKMKDAITIKMAEKNAIIDETTLTSLLSTAVQNGINDFDADFTSMQEKMAEGLNIPDEEWEKLQEQINEKLKEMGIEPIKINFETGEIDTTKKESKEESTKETYAIDSFGKISSGINSMVSSMDQLGIEIPSGMKEVLGGINAVVSILTTISAVMEAIEAIQSATSFMPFFAKGGIVPKAANGYFVQGNHFSNDMTPVMANAGELILNRAAQGNIASQLQGMQRASGGGTPYVSGEQIFLGLNNYLSRTGKGELITSR